MSEVQEVIIHRTIIDNRPEQLKMDFCLLRRTAIDQLIEQILRHQTAVRSVGKYIKRWRFTLQKID